MTRSTLDTGICATLPDETLAPPHGLVICKGCRHWIDPETCRCGEPESTHGMGTGHGFVSMGCDCHRVKPAPLVVYTTPIPDVIWCADCGNEHAPHIDCPEHD